MAATGGARALSVIRVNVAGEGEVPEVLNVNGKWILDPAWRVSRDGRLTLRDLINQGHQFVIADNRYLPFADASVDIIYTNNVPLDTFSHLGAYPQRREIWRILKPGGNWFHNSVPQVRP